MTAQIPLISIIMSVYNGERYLRESIESILAQTYSNFEFIIIDDASTDRTLEILCSYQDRDRRVQVLQNETNQGVPGSVNRGVAVSKGELIGRHDADDISHPERLARQIEYLERHPGVGFLSTDFDIIDDDQRVIDTVRQPEGNAELQKLLEGGNIFAQPTILIKRQVFDAVGGYNPHFRLSQDYELYLRLAEVTELANLPIPLFSVRFHRSSVSRTKREMQLALKQLAWEMAVQRRAGLPEPAFPEDVVKAYPPDPNKLFQDARGISYLYYVSRQMDAAAETVRRARELATVEQNRREDWETWVLGSANRAAALEKTPQAGEQYLRWMAAALKENGLEIAYRKLAARFYAEQTFRENQAMRPADAARCARRAVAHDPTWLLNRGFLKVFLGSLGNHPR